MDQKGSRPSSLSISPADDAVKQNGDGSDNYDLSPGAGNHFNVSIPGISLPKGGGSIKGLGEKFEMNAVNGTASLSVPLPFSAARGFGGAPAISYNSGGGSGIFGMGWTLGLPSIKRKTEKQLPQYLDDSDSDT